VPDTDEEVLHEERLFLASATSHSADLRWLHPGDFALPLHGQLYECLTTLHHRGDPIDPVTLMWEAQRRSLLTTIDPADLLTLTSRTNSTSSPDYWGERILQRALLTGAQNAAHHIQTYTDDPSNTPHQLITGSRRALATFTEIRTRWHTTQPHPPTASGPRPPHTAPTVPRLRSTTAHAFTPSTLPATSARPTR
jgi:replicative DNA helicase